MTEERYDPSKATGHAPEVHKCNLTPEQKAAIIAQQRERLGLNSRGKPGRRKAGEFPKLPPKG